MHSTAASSVSASRQRLVDCLCLALLVVLLVAPFLSRLGFYSDDWWVLASFQRDLTQGNFGLHTIVRGFEARPLQGAYLALLYCAFGLEPLGYHLVNTAVLAAAMVSFYQLLIRMKLHRALAFAAVAILIALPQLSTVRVWYSTFQVPLALLFALLSMHAQLSFVQTGARWRAAAAAVFGIASVFSYEIFAPIILAFPAWALLEKRAARPKLDLRREVGLTVGAVVVVALSILTKGIVTDRTQKPDFAMYMKGLKRLVDPSYDWRTEGSINIFGTLDVNLWQPFVGMQRGTSAALTGEIGYWAVLAGLAVGAIALWRLWGSCERETVRASSIRAILLGAATFIVAHSLFLIVSQIMFSPSGMGNRTLVGMALGVALLFAGLAGFAASRLTGANCSRVLALGIALVLVTLSWRAEQVYRYWAGSWSIEQRLFASAQRDLKSIPANSTVIFHNLCPYYGPAVVMETVESADFLTLALGRPLFGDTSADRMAVTRAGLTTWIYGDRYLYPYGPSLYAYDPERHLVTQLPDLATAVRYFGSGNQRKCPQGYVGQGVLI
jgi:hypothetical protein